MAVKGMFVSVGGAHLCRKCSSPTYLYAAVLVHVFHFNRSAERDALTCQQISIQGVTFQVLTVRFSGVLLAI
jgi:hypothetical protein